MAGATSIMYGHIDAKGALNVQFFCDPKSILDKAEIIELIKNPPPDTTEQPEPFWCNATGPHRFVYHLSVPNWYFPDYPELQAGKVPWRLKTPDPAGSFTRPILIPESDIYGGDDHRIKTIIVDFAHKDNSNMPTVFDLHINIWNDPDDPNSWKTPITIDPGSKNPPPWG